MSEPPARMLDGTELLLDHIPISNAAPRKSFLIGPRPVECWDPGPFFSYPRVGHRVSFILHFCIWSPRMRAWSGNFNVQAWAARTGHGGQKGVTVNIVIFIASDIPSSGAKLDHIINISSRQSCLDASLGADSCLVVSKLVRAIGED